MRPSNAGASLLFLLAVVGVVVAAKGKATQAPLDCPEPDCSGKDCKTKTGSDGCLVCECGTSCPTLVCGPGCRPEVNVTQDRCPECTCDGDSPADGGHRNCPEVQCPADCEKEQVIPPHRCPWCLCHPITARKTLEKFGERHCPRELMEMLFRQADGLFKHTQILREQLHYQDLAVRTLDGNITGGDPLASGLKPGCSNPECTGKDCRLVPGEDGCPHCSCGEVLRSKDKDVKNALADKAHRVQKRKSQKDDSSEESKESDEKKSHSVQRRHGDRDDSSEEADKDNVGEATSTTSPLTTLKTDAGSRRRRYDPLGHLGNDTRPRVARRVDHTDDVLNVTAQVQPGQVQCVVPVCEPYCKQRPAEHGCLVCDCPDVCPDIVCGAGCQPYFTDASRCERCVCNPHAGRDQMADVFASYCSEPTLHRMIADFGALERMMHDVQQQSFHHQHLITRAEQARGIHGPASEELKALFARQQYERHHEPHRPQHAHVTPLPHQPYQTEEPSKPPHRAHKKHGGRRDKQDGNRSP
uniref:Putative conserved secreted protein n=1 Tax=Ixodes scapularis TaxID=6945 RepID=A0A4D5RPN1_IXOSC